MSKTLLQNAWIYGPKGVFRRGGLLLSGGRIERVVPDGELAEGSPMDLGGAWVLPGFVDTHFHLTSLAQRRLRCDLSGVRSAEELVEVLGAWASGIDSPHVAGVEWDEADWEDPAFPTREMLDRVDRARPVLARRICGHLGVANTALLKQLSDHPGFIDGASGLLREHAVWEAGRLTDPEPEVLAGCFEDAIGELHRLGVTAIHDIVSPGKLEPYLAGIAASSAPLRIDILVHATPDHVPEFRRMCEAVRSVGWGEAASTDYLRLAGVKCFLDGSLGGRTAALNAPYEGSSERGTLLMEREELQAVARASYEGGFVCAMHAIGDRAIDLALDVVQEFPASAEVFRIEHCEIVGPLQLRRLEGAPVYLALQPNFARRWGAHRGLYEERIGVARYMLCNRFRALEQAGVEFVFGSDGMPPGPLYGMKGATEHPIAGERIDRRSAIERYTRRPHEVGLHRRDAGRLEAGQLADLVVLDRDPLVADFDSISVVRTFVGGEVVFDARELAPG